jgi:signal transduction histidine kinase
MTRLAGLLPRNWTIRVRLTVLYGGMFFVAGALLLAVTYGLLKQSLDSRPPRPPGPGAFVSNVQSGSGDAPPPPAQLDPEDVQRIQAEIAAEQTRFRDATLNSLLQYGALALGVVGLAAVAFGWLMSERVLLRPLQRITETATRIGRDRAGGQSGLHERIALRGPQDEITELAGTFDAMLERLDRSFDGQRRFVANASHELRTPLAINRALLEVALTRPGVSADLQQLGGTLLAVNARHERLIDGLLTLARSENEVVERVAVDLAHIVEYVTDELGPAAATASVAVEADLAPALVRGDPVLLEQLVTNLLSNGIRHNAALSGWVRLSTSATPDGAATLVVTNTGPTVPPYETEAIFEPFRRLGADRLSTAQSNGTPAGVGLGLSIVRAVARAHGGNAHAVPRDGGGLVVTVTLPAH